MRSDRSTDETTQNTLAQEACSASRSVARRLVGGESVLLVDPRPAERERTWTLAATGRCRPRSSRSTMKR